MREWYVNLAKKEDYVEENHKDNKISQTKGTI